MADLNSESTVSISTATRTLLAAGYEITSCERQPEYAEIQCERVSKLGPVVRYTFAITDNESFRSEQIEDIKRIAMNNCRAVVLVGARSSDLNLGWHDFLEAMGGAIPSWRALSLEFGQQLQIASRNQLPSSLSGEAWQIFEDLAGDGLEFIFGRKISRLGGRKRGRLVSDMLAQFPDSQLIVVDTKASGEGFDATWPNLRALVEYVLRQKQRQKGYNEVFGAVIISSSFQQTPESLGEISRRFLAETSATLAFLTSDVLAAVVELMRNDLTYRNAMQWRVAFSGGIVYLKTIKEELQKARTERFKTPED
jgi:hypothetical protein